MRRLFVLGLIVVTSLAAYGIAVKRPGVKDKSLRAAFGEVMECLGTSSIFLAVNLVLSVALILIARGLTGRFVSLYMAADWMLLILSVLQGFVFQLWWRK
jgi:hypothetical protein